MTFFSQICTDVEQSERLIALGLKKETADMVHMAGELRKYYHPKALPVFAEDYFMVFPDVLPAWSLHRLIEMMPRTIKANDELFFLLVSKEDVFYDNTEGTAYSSFINRNGLYYNITLCIEWLIKEGYFNKEYLV